MSIRIVRGDPIAPGFGVGRLHVSSARQRVRPSAGPPGDPCWEVDRFRCQVDALEREIEQAVDRLESEAFCAEAEIMRTHLAMLRDPDLHRQVLELIQESRHRAETAVEQVLESMAEMLAGADDPILSERAADLRDLAIRLTTGLSEGQASDPVIDEITGTRRILALSELMPSVVLAARQLGAAGFVVEHGTTVSHGAILAKSFGIPVVRVACLDFLKAFADREVLVWDGGEVLVEPTEAELASRRPSEAKVPIERAPDAPRVRIWLSIVDPDQLEGVDWKGIEGVGLYRSEALFMRHREDFPSEREQFETYRRLFRLAGRSPVIFRTVDLGADKPLEHMHFGPQENPCLGLRAHRLFRFHPEILVTQVRAVLRAAQGDHRLRLMFPMLESTDQLRFVRGLVERAVRSLEDEGLSFQRDFLLGALIETPSAVWSFDRFLGRVDFASVGTNDLVQYLFAVERNAANVAELFQPEHPVVLQILRSLARQAADAGKPLSVCGEVAADPAMLPVLAGLGIRDLSVAPAAVAAVRRALWSQDEAACRRLANRCAEAESVEEVRALLGRPSEAGTRPRGLGADAAVDPVCGMMVHTRDTPYYLRLGSTVHYFCSYACLKRYSEGCGG